MARTALASPATPIASCKRKRPAAQKAATEAGSGKIEGRRSGVDHQASTKRQECESALNQSECSKVVGQASGSLRQSSTSDSDAASDHKRREEQGEAGGGRTRRRRRTDSNASTPTLDTKPQRGAGSDVSGKSGGGRRIFSPALRKGEVATGDGKGTSFDASSSDASASTKGVTSAPRAAPLHGGPEELPSCAVASLEDSDSAAPAAARATATAGRPNGKSGGGGGSSSTKGSGRENKRKAGPHTSGGKDASHASDELRAEGVIGDLDVERDSDCARDDAPVAAAAAAAAASAAVAHPAVTDPMDVAAGEKQREIAPQSGTSLNTNTVTSAAAAAASSAGGRAGNSGEASAAGKVPASAAVADNTSDLGGGSTSSTAAAAASADRAGRAGGASSTDAAQAGEGNAAAAAGGDAGDESNTDDDEEAEDEEFNPYCFIKHLPPYSDVKHFGPGEPVLPAKRHLRGSKPVTLVLDLDETLVHCTVEPIEQADLAFCIRFNDENFQVYVRKRPHLEAFLEAVSELFEVVVFTASQRVYAETLLNLIDPKKRFIRHRLYRDACLPVEGNYLKDLNVLGRDLSRVALIDNSAYAYGFQIDNGIPIESWFDDDEDDELLRLLPFLRQLAKETDVRPLIRDRFKTRELLDAACNHA